MTGLSDYADRFPKTLSGGMRQRLAIARALVLEPRVLFADEPMGALDEPTRNSMRDIFLRAVRDTGFSVLIATHDVRTAVVMSNKTVMLSARPGHIIREWTRPDSKVLDDTSVERQPWFADLCDEIVRSFPIQLETSDGCKDES